MTRTEKIHRKGSAWTEVRNPLPFEESCSACRECWQTATQRGWRRVQPFPAVLTGLGPLRRPLPRRARKGIYRCCYRNLVVPALRWRQRQLSPAVRTAAEKEMPE